MGWARRVILTQRRISGILSLLVNHGFCVPGVRFPGYVVDCFGDEISPAEKALLMDSLDVSELKYNLCYLYYAYERFMAEKINPLLTPAQRRQCNLLRGIQKTFIAF